MTEMFYIPSIVVLVILKELNTSTALSKIFFTRTIFHCSITILYISFIPNTDYFIKLILFDDNNKKTTLINIISY